MSQRVVLESHQFNDDYVYVPSIDDLKDVYAKIKSVQESLSAFATETALNSSIEDSNRKIAQFRKDFQSFLDLILSALQDGQWKETFAGEIQNLLNELENREKRINQVLKEKMEKLAQKETSDEKIKRIFIEQEQTIRTIIQNAGMKLKNELDQKMASAEIVNVLRAESQTIRWE